MKDAMKAAPDDTLWHARSGAGPRLAPLAGDARADVVIVGGGFLGLSAALAFAERRIDAIVLEGGEIGAGASGRNAGFVVPHFSRADPAAVRAALAPPQAERLLRIVETGAERVFDLSRRLDLGREAEQVGWLQPAHSAAAARMLEARVAEWQARGRPVTFLSPAEIAERTGTGIYRGALADASGGVVNPLALARGMARLAAEAGARIHTGTPVALMRADAGGWTLTTATGATVGADRVLLATNAGTFGAAGPLGRAAVPLHVYQIATRPLDAATRARIAPQRQPVSDTRTNIFTYRLDADDRLISGGMALVPVAAEARMARRIARRLADELALPAVPEVEHVWRGTAAMTQTALPLLARHGEGAFGAVGCNGRGVAFTTRFGAALADWMADGADPAEAPLPLEPPRPVPLRPLARMAPSLILLRGMRADRRAMRETP